MKTIVITGGTDGMGKALGLEYLSRGDRVVAIGSNHDKGAAFIAAAERLDAADRANFIQADLSLVAQNRRVVAELVTRFPIVDALVLGARYYRSHRYETAEGFEANFALFYLSRYLFGHGLAAQLEKAESPVILDLAGPGGELSRINWQDLQFTEGYDADVIMGQCGKLSDLLGVAFAARYPQSRIRYVLMHPGLTATGFTGQYDAVATRHVAQMRERGQPVSVAVARILHHLDHPPAAPLSAFMQLNSVDVAGEPFDPAAAQRLSRLTEQLLREL